MRDVRMKAVIRAVESRYPGTRVEVTPAQCPDEPSVPWFLWILRVPEKDLNEVNDFALRLALDLYGRKEIRFSIGVLGPKNSRDFLARRRAEEARKRVRSRRTGRVRRAPLARRASA